MNIELATDESVLQRDFYCPSCGYECIVAFINIPLFETCECSNCGGIMFLI